MTRVLPRRPRARRSLLATLTLLVASALAVTCAVTAPSSSAAGAASLSISARNYYGGQGLVFSGSIGKAEATRIWLEFHMGLPGDSWTPVEDSERRTAADGSFRFRFPARSMNGIRLRVAADGSVTPPVTLHARDQAAHVTVRTVGEQLDTDGYVEHAGYPVLAGRPMQVTVDTSPDGEPVLDGRGVDLQVRGRSTRWTTRWRTVASARVGSGGVARFRLDAPRRDKTYRARLADWSEGGSEIGWFPSFPVAVDALPAAARRSVRADAPTVDAPAPAGATSRLRRTDPWYSSAGTTAAAKHGWSPALWDFAWEYGESLSDRPFRGADRRGRWLEYSDGSGIAAKQNGGLQLESSFSDYPRPGNAGPGDHGTTAVQLTGNARSHGRWEVRIRPWTAVAPRAEPGGDYRIRAELVPARARLRACGARSIVIADLTPNTPRVRFGASTPEGRRAWRGSRGGIVVSRMPRAYSVEVAPDHISWFIDGTVVGTVNSRAAVPGVPLTLRISMVGRGQREMDHTYAIMDWMRGFDLERGEQVRSGAALKRRRSAAGC
ncbi:hypothetical protein E8D34_06560 [Nocardioides sp. GY 10113]|uniref:hypothetical protein n=1 Tax=Nocardioides sp. GY 10113 TaxID=2569761 RepID=UPI0010A7BD7E|nr:hypothetical protein [Nocardioides sp. GY 10113]TIC87950.1 hypothetical protein E8D34_06560 [Nocardioides sp. GY 10113]